MSEKVISLLIFLVASSSYSVRASAYSYGGRPSSQGRPPVPPNQNNPHNDVYDDSDWTHPSNSGDRTGKYVLQPPEDFSYSKQGGAGNWENIYPKCGGDHQSPINLAHTRSQALGPLHFHHYWDNNNRAEINNTGKVAEVKLLGNKKLPHVTGGPLVGDYELVGLHFHWGSNEHDGSEHMVGGQQFTMEAHVVHYKKAYGTAEEAMNHADGLAVTSFLIQAGNQVNKDFQGLVQTLPKIRRVGVTTELSAKAAFYWFKDRHHDNYFTYRGSLTTPPCSEVVTWVVYQKPVYISSAQAAEFRTLLDTDGVPINNNHRPAQYIDHPHISFVRGGHH